MLLAIDAGNTETVFGLYDGPTLRSHWRLSSQTNRTADEAWLLFRSWCQASAVDPACVTGAILSSVVPSLTAVFSDVCGRHLGVKPLVVSADTDTGLTLRIDSPRTAGADRICNAVAGIAAYGGPLVVVDFGTATTFDVISAEREYLGGAICLGLKGAAQELHRIAAKLPRVDLVFPDRAIGRNTEAGIQSGILWGAVFVTDGLVGRIGEELGYPDVTAVATGGLAPLIAGRTRRIRHIEPFLTLEGMRLIHERAASAGKS
jgi:type III pantothenate kinase